MRSSNMELFIRSFGSRRNERLHHRVAIQAIFSHDATYYVGIWSYTALCVKSCSPWSSVISRQDHRPRNKHFAVGCSNHSYRNHAQNVKTALLIRFASLINHIFFEMNLFTIEWQCRRSFCGGERLTCRCLELPLVMLNGAHLGVGKVTAGPPPHQSFRCRVLGIVHTELLCTAQKRHFWYFF